MTKPRKLSRKEMDAAKGGSDRRGNGNNVDYRSANNAYGDTASEYGFR